MQYLHVALSALFSVAVLFIITKIIGCRQMSELSLFDYVNGITIGSIASELAISGFKNWESPLIAMCVFGVISLLLSVLSDVSIGVRRFVAGKPCVLYTNGKLCYRNMRRARIDTNELLTQARNRGYFELSQIEKAILESNGKISFLPKSGSRPLTPDDVKLNVKKAELSAVVVLDGKILERNLNSTSLDKAKLMTEIKKHTDASLDRIMLATCMKDGTVEVYTKELKIEPDALE